MKVVSIILFFFLLGIISIPCVNGLQHHAIFYCSEEHQDIDGNHCSPFCFCDCCQNSIFYEAGIIHFVPVFCSCRFQCKSVSIYVSSVRSAVWQPPKMS